MTPLERAPADQARHTLSTSRCGAARLSARLFGTRAAAAFVNGWRRLGVVLSGLSFLGFGYCLMG